MNTLLTFLLFIENPAITRGSTLLSNFGVIDNSILNLFFGGFDGADLRQIIFITFPLALLLITYYFFQNKRLKLEIAEIHSNTSQNEFTKDQAKQEIHNLKLKEKGYEDRFDHYLSDQFAETKTSIDKAFYQFSETLKFTISPDKYLFGKAGELQDDLGSIDASLSYRNEENLLTDKIPSKYSPFYKETSISDLNKSFTDYLPLPWASEFCKELIENLNASENDFRIKILVEDQKGRVSITLTNVNVKIANSIVEETLDHPKLNLGKIKKEVTLTKKLINNTKYCIDITIKY